MKRRPAVAAAWGVAIGVACRVLAMLSATSPLDADIATLALLLFALPAATIRLRPLAAIVVGVVAGGVSTVLDPTALPLAMTFSLAVVAIAIALRQRVARGRGLAAAAAPFVAAAWVFWPFWLAPAIARVGGSAPAWSTQLHPIFALDAVDIDVPWTEQAHIYGNTPLGIDLPVAMPPSIWPATLAHAGLAIAALGVVALRLRSARRQRQRRPAAPPPPTG